MFRLTALLAAVVFVVMLVGGRDTGQQRFGLAGVYPPLVPVSASRPAPTEAEAVQVAARPAAITPQVQRTAVRAVAAAEPPAPPAQSGLTLAMPLVTEPALGGVQTADGLFSADSTAPAAAAAATSVHYVIGNEVNVRETPSTKAAVLGKLARGEAVTVVATETPGWSMIRIEGDGIEGYVASRFLSGERVDDTGPAAD